MSEPDITDEQIGFLAQQAIEKAIKAALSLLGLSYRRTHDLSEMERCIELTPFAAEQRNALIVLT